MYIKSRILQGHKPERGDLDVYCFYLLCLPFNEFKSEAQPLLHSEHKLVQYCREKFLRWGSPDGTKSGPIAEVMIAENTGRKPNPLNYGECAPYDNGTLVSISDSKVYEVYYSFKLPEYKTPDWYFLLDAKDTRLVVHESEITDSLFV